MTQGAGDRIWAVIVGCALPASTRIAVAISTIYELRVRRSRSVVPVAITAVRRPGVVHKLAVRQMARRAACRRTGSRIVSQRLMAFAVAGYVAVTEFVHESKCRTCIVSVDIIDVVSLSNRVV